ncbi:hypothetical protein BH10BAC5_BH10BAC5_17170 [soil metagenome]
MEIDILYSKTKRSIKGQFIIHATTADLNSIGTQIFQAVRNAKSTKIKVIIKDVEFPTDVLNYESKDWD